VCSDFLQLKCVGAKPNLTNYDPYGYKPTSERKICPRGRHLTSSSSRKKEVAKNYPRPTNIIAQELCNNIRRSLVHDDVAKSITVMELQRAKEEWMCHTLHELYDEMELWGGTPCSTTDGQEL
jgi:hypothetical protein